MPMSRSSFRVVLTAVRVVPHRHINFQPLKTQGKRALAGSRPAPSEFRDAFRVSPQAPSARYMVTAIMVMRLEHESDNDCRYASMTGELLCLGTLHITTVQCGRSITQDGDIVTYLCLHWEALWWMSCIAHAAYTPFTVTCLDKDHYGICRSYGRSHASLPQMLDVALVAFLLSSIPGFSGSVHCSDGEPASVASSNRERQLIICCSAILFQLTSILCDKVQSPWCVLVRLKGVPGGASVVAFIFLSAAYTSAFAALLHWN
ncbi:hypothetical protein OE88DRAFT_1666368 [Heliocybe sulcata]|uniref:Uncharacterized protein n=1 Tax=Heliocybe sulcata TaxID=5364 RepID=A0A5C3MQL2_9AGAM|nr:hypothetical protein OE88DRAFT_1666368 [Heliocybe sulcata]